MPIFAYRAVDQSGKDHKGTIDAPNKKQAAVLLQGQNLYPVLIQATKESAKGAAKQKRKKERVPSKVITAFTRQFAVLVSTGVPYDKAFEIIIQENEHSGFQSVLSEMKAQVVEGSTLAGAMEVQTEYFPSMYVSMVRAGEAGGLLADVLERLALYRESTEELGSKIQKAMIYPAIMSSLGVAIVVFMVTFILPKLTPIFENFGQALPLPTRIVMAISDFVIEGWPFILSLIVAFVLVGRSVLATKWGLKKKDQLLLQLPQLRTIMVKLIVFRFTQTLATLMRSGVDLKHSLEILRKVTGNRVFEESMEDIIQDVTKKGLPLSQTLRKNGLFSSTVIQMIRIGEESSQLEKMLTRVSEILEKEVKDTIEKAIALLEPMIILLMFFFIGFIIISIMLPMMAMNQLV